MRPKNHHLKGSGDPESMVIMRSIIIGGILGIIDHHLLLEILLRITGADPSIVLYIMVVQGPLNEPYLY